MNTFKLRLNKINFQSKYILIAAFGCVTLFLLNLANYHYQSIIFPFQSDYREGASLVSTQALIKGLNPYDLKLQPQYTNVYGIGYHFFVYPFAKVFGATLALHRSISAFFIIISSVVLFIALRWIKVPSLFALMGAGILYSHLLYFITPMARPDAFGFFLFLCSILIPWRYNYSTQSLVIGLILSILGWLTKPYFIFGIFYLTLYLFLFHSKKKGLMFGTASLLSVVAVLLTIHIPFEVYLNNTLYTFFNVNNNAKDVSYALKQIWLYGKNNFGLILILFFPLLSLLLSFQFIKFSRFKFYKSDINHIVDLLKLDQPLLKLNVDLIPFCLALSSFIFWFSLGRNQGNWMVYLYQLVTPFLIIFAFQIINNQSIRFISIVLIGLLVLNFINASTLYPKLKVDNSQWKNLETLVSKYNNIFHTPAITSIILEQGKTIYDSGQSQYFIDGALVESSFISNWFSQPANKIKERNNEFLQEVKKSIKAKKFDLIVLTKQSPFISQEFLKPYYENTTSFFVDMPFSIKPWQRWKIYAWQPRE